MQRDDTVYLRHILETAEKAVDQVSDKTRATFDADEIFRVALTHWVQIIGEAASRLTDETRTAHPEIPWHRVIGMRHRIVHDYMNIDADILWEVVTHSLPELIARLIPIVPPEEA
ncbi:MAG: DUF86 domain-containing protein [Phycisphaerae bacterium]|nr:DUF86 domain-containing protein [Phycisphaerae bacterium]